MLLYLPLQRVAPLKRFFQRARQFLCPQIRALDGCLILTDLFHQALVLLFETVPFAALCLELLLPTSVYGDLLLGAADRTKNPSEGHADYQHARQHSNFDGSNLRHCSIPFRL